MKRCIYCDARINFIKRKNKYIPVDEHPIAILIDSGKLVTGHPVHNCADKPSIQSAVATVAKQGVDAVLDKLSKQFK